MSLPFILVHTKSNDMRILYYHLIPEIKYTQELNNVTRLDTFSYSKQFKYGSLVFKINFLDTYYFKCNVR